MPDTENNARWPSILLSGRLRVLEKCIRTLLVTTASLWLATWAYLGRYRPTQKKAESARPLRKEMGSKSKSEKLVCRYCGSDDLAPSFIKRRDRRCRKCFSKRYGSAAPAQKAKVKN